MRLDRFLRDALPGLTAVQRNAALRERRISVDGQKVWMASWELTPNSRVAFDGEPLEAVVPTWDPRLVLWEDNRFVVVNKPAGLRPEPRGPTDRTDLLSAARTFYGPDLVAATRLDRDTSGVMILSLPGPHRKAMDKALADRSVTKEYQALVDPDPALERMGSFNWPIGRDTQRREAMCVVRSGGSSALTEYSVTDQPSGRLSLHPVTGRTHQLRVHLAAAQCPIRGDVLYGGTSAERLMLHAVQYTVAQLGIDVTAPCPF